MGLGVKSPEEGGPEAHTMAAPIWSIACFPIAQLDCSLVWQWFVQHLKDLNFLTPVEVFALDVLCKKKDENKLRQGCKKSHIFLST
jgi:hypothetical protein